METPRNVPNFVRNPTSRLSERKKNLFSCKNEAKGDVMRGIVPLQIVHFNSEDKNYADNKNDKNLNGFSANRNCFKSTPEEYHTKMFSSEKHSYASRDSTPIRNRTEDNLEHMFSRSMMLKVKEDENILLKDLLKRNSSTITRNVEQETRMSNKRRTDTSENLVSSPKRRITNVTNISFSPSTIPTKTFYSNSQISSLTTHFLSSESSNASTKARKTEQYRRKVPHINKGVSHKIRRRIKQKEIGKFDIHSPIDIDHILSSIRNDKLRSIIISRRQEKEQVELIHRILKSSQDPIHLAKPLSTLIPTINGLFNNKEEYNGDFLETSRESNSPDFSDLESVSDDVGDNVETNRGDQVTLPITYNRKEEAHTPIESKNKFLNSNIRRKFFKSRDSICSRKEVQITGNIRAEMCNGKITLVEHKKVKKRKLKERSSAGHEFSAEQATVDAILQSLDNSSFGDTPPFRSFNDKKNFNMTEPLISGNSLHSSDHSDYAVFRNQIPYNTTDPELIEQQHLLLDFLINNNICTEENFKIFIADPNNHKEEAASIVDQMIVVINSEESNKSANCDRNCDLLSNSECVVKEDSISNTNRIPEHDCTQEIIHSKIPEIIGKVPLKVNNSTTQTVDYNMKMLADNLNKNPTQGLICRGEGSADPVLKSLFPIFYTGRCQPLPQKTCRRVLQNSRNGHGANQYQIDAGQRDFGAHQCKQCELLYTAHEPEEEKLHRDYHESVNILRFKGWTDEDVVAFYPDWSTDGRIIRISNNSHIKRIERLKEILNIVDKELGFSSYIIPQLFVAYLAVRKCQIVGLCLVQPLEKAHKYLYVNNVDCCTEEEFEAKCGISRIWVSPHHRRLSIGSKLVKAVQLHTILGEEIHFDKLAFSAPTEDGKQFAKKVTKMEEFLVYF